MNCMTCCSRATRCSPVSIIEAHGDGYVIVGATTDEAYDPRIVILVDADGQVHWASTLHEGVGVDAVAMENGGILVAGIRHLPYASLIDGAGQQVWAKTEEPKAFLQQELEVFPDAHERIVDLVAEGDKVAVRHRFQGTQKGPMGPHPPTGKEMASEYIAIYGIEQGRIAEAWAEWDNLSVLVQLGHYELGR